MRDCISASLAISFCEMLFLLDEHIRRRVYFQCTYVQNFYKSSNAAHRRQQNLFDKQLPREVKIEIKQINIHYSQMNKSVVKTRKTNIILFPYLALIFCTISHQLATMAVKWPRQIFLWIDRSQENLYTVCFETT